MKGPAHSTVHSAGELFDEFVRGDADRLADHDELDHIEPPLPALVLGDEGLRPAQALGELRLRQLGLHADITHQGQEIAVEVG